MQSVRAWQVAYWSLWIAFVATAALNMLRVRAGFLTNYAADLVVPALLYIIVRGLAERHGTPKLLQRWFGGTPERAAIVLFLASAGTELSQRYWPKGIFSGRYDSLDLAAYGLGISLCYICDKRSSMT